MTWNEYLATIDASHPMTTAPKHIAELCEIVAGKDWRILELGSHAGLSTAALAIAAPESTIACEKARSSSSDAGDTSGSRPAASNTDRL